MIRRKHSGWSIVTAHFVTLFFVLGGAYDTGSIWVPELLKHFPWRRAQVSMLFTVVLAASALCAPFTGWLLDLVEARAVVATGAAVVAVGLIAASQATCFLAMLAAFLLIGLGLGASTYVPAEVVISNWFADSNRLGSALGTAMAGEPVGGMVMTLVAGYSISVGGWRVGYVALAIPILLLVIPLTLGVIRQRPPVLVAARDSVSRHLLSGAQVGEAIRSFSFWLVMLADFCAGFIVTGVYIHLAIYLIGLGYTAHSATIAASAVMGLGAMGQPLLGMLGDRITARNALALTFCLIALGLVSALESHSSHLCLGLFICLFGFTLSAPATLPAMVLLTSMGSRRFGSLAGLMVCFGTAGAALGPLVGGYMFDLTGSYSGFFALCIMLCVVGGAAVLLVVSYTVIPSEAREAMAE